MQGTSVLRFHSAIFILGAQAGVSANRAVLGLGASTDRNPPHAGAASTTLWRDFSPILKTGLENAATAFNKVGKHFIHVHPFSLQAGKAILTASGASGSTSPLREHQGGPTARSAPRTQRPQRP